MCGCYYDMLFGNYSMDVVYSNVSCLKLLETVTAIKFGLISIIPYSVISKQW